MHARNVMQTNVVTVAPDTAVRAIAERLPASRISAVPVLDEQRRLVGIVSEGHLIRRPESDTERRPSWWLRLFATPEERVIAYLKSRGGRASDVMTRDVISVGEDASLEEIAETLERHRIKRAPVVRDGKLCGIVSRADLLRGLVARQVAPTAAASDQTIKAAVENALAESGAQSFLSVVVADGVGGVKAVRDEIGVLPPSALSLMWAE